MRTIQTLTIVFASCSLGDVHGADLKDLFSQSNPTVQETLETIANNLNQLSDTRNRIQALQTVGKLRETNDDQSELVRQIAIFSAAPGEQQPLMSLAILELLDLKPSVIIESLSPYLNTENTNLRSFVRDWFQSHDNGGSDATPLTPVNFEDYEDYLRRKLQKKEAIPEAFSAYIFERSPSRALIAFNRADKRGEIVDRLNAMRDDLEQKANGGVDQLPRPKAGFGSNELLLAEHQISNAIWLKHHKYGEQFHKVLPDVREQLQVLATQEQWWVRLYVVEVMRRHAELRDPKSLGDLRHDPHELVRASASSVVK